MYGAYDDRDFVRISALLSISASGDPEDHVPWQPEVRDRPAAGEPRRFRH